MKISAVDNYKFNSINFEGKKNKEAQKPIHSSTPIKAIPVAVLIAMSPMNIQRAEATPLPAPTEVAAKTSRPQNFVESKKFKTEHNDIFVGLSKDKTSGNYRVWIDCNTHGLLQDDHLNGYVTEYNTNNYKIEDSFGYKVQAFSFDNIYVTDANKSYQSDAIANKEVCNYVKNLVSTYTTDITPKRALYTMQMDKSGNLEYKRGDNDKYRIAKNNPMNFGEQLSVWDIETSTGQYRVRVYNKDGNKSNFETISIEDLKRKGPEIKVEEIIAANNHIYCNADEVAFTDRYQINARHDKAGDITLVNKELWDFIYTLLSSKQCNNAAGGKETHFIHSGISQQGAIGKGTSF